MAFSENEHKRSLQIQRMKWPAWEKRPLSVLPFDFYIFHMYVYAPDSYCHHVKYYVFFKNLTMPEF